MPCRTSDAGRPCRCEVLLSICLQGVLACPLLAWPPHQPLLPPLRSYRSCDRFDYQKEVEEYDMECMGVSGDKKCGFDDPAPSDDNKDGDSKDN